VRSHLPYRAAVIAEFHLRCNQLPPSPTGNCEYRLLDLCLGKVFDFSQLHMRDVWQFIGWDHAVDNRRAFRLERLVDGLAQLAGLFGPEAHAAAGAPAQRNPDW